MIYLRSAQDLDAAASLSYFNMKPHYDYYGVEWDKTKILNMTESLENLEVLYEEQVVGVLRLTFDEQGCHLRDLQISGHFQNKGLGGAVLNACYNLAKERGALNIWLKVFKQSPAFRLYKRHDFQVYKEDDNLYYMKRELVFV